MKQLFIKKGVVIIENSPIPHCDDNSALVKVTHSVISVGSELSTISGSKKESLAHRVIKQPSKALKIGDLIAQKGLFKAIKSIRKLQAGIDQTPALQIGYSCAGLVIEAGKNVLDLAPGDRVACGGLGKAVHAEVVSVPRNLIVKVPEAVDLREASSVTIGAIALQGVRRADVHIGEYVAVIGLGLIGQITSQLLNTAGCRVIGIDIIEEKLDIAKKNGIFRTVNASFYYPVKEIQNITQDKGVDACIITASSSSDEIVQQAMEMTRKKGTVVVVGAVGLGIKRHPFYKKEIDLKISCSYGPGRYDELYEEKGIDYPYAYVRWTENRNMEEYLKLLEEKKTDFASLITKQCPIEEAPQIYEEMKLPRNKHLAVVLTYNFDEAKAQNAEEKVIYYDKPKKKKRTKKVRVGIIGAGQFAREVHLPNLKSLSDIYEIYAISCRNGANAKEIARQFSANYATTDYRQVINDPEIDMVLIATRHNLHAKLAIEAAQAGKAVFLEKPMAINLEELNDLEKVIKETQIPFMVGFNRRFSPCAKMAKQFLGETLNPIMVMYRVNAPHLPPEHWVYGEEGGGRIIGEACHMIDFFGFLTESTVNSFDISSIQSKIESAIAEDNFIVTFKYENGSICTLLYTSQGGKALGKEYIEIHADQKTIIIDNFRKIIPLGTKHKEIAFPEVQKGHLEELREFFKFIKAERDQAPFPLKGIIETTKITLKMKELIKQS